MRSNEKQTLQNALPRRDFVKTAAASMAGASVLANNCFAADSMKGLQTGLHQATIRESAFDRTVRAADAAGFQYFDLMYRNMKPYIDENGEDAVIKLFKSVSVKPGILAAFPRFSEMDAKKFKALIPEIQQTLALCKKLGITQFAFICIRGPKGDDRSFYQTAVDRTRETADIAADYGMMLTMEPIGPTRYFNNTKRVNDFLEDVKKPNLGWILDTFHLYRGGDTLEDAIPYMDERMSTVQFHDIEKGIDLMKSKDDVRVMPGDGYLPLGDIVRKLVELKYHSYLSVELFRPSYWAMDPEPVAQEAYDKLVKVVTEALA
jgi:2-keto-myo-inositol isomerase